MASILNVDQVKNANGSTDAPPVNIPGHIIQMQSSSSTAASTINSETYADSTVYDGNNYPNINQ